MSTYTGETESLSERRSILIGGLSLAARHWRAFVWTYVFNLGLAWVLSLGVRSQLAAVTAHSLAAQRIAGGFDLTTLAGIMNKASEGPGNGPANFFSIPAFVLLYFVLVPGTLFSFVTGTPARLSALLGNGLPYFWRFFRVTLLSLITFAIVLGPLFALRKGWLKHQDLHIVGYPAFWQGLWSLVAVLLVAAAIRLYFDLVEVYTVQLGQHLRPGKNGGEPLPDRRVRRTLRPSWRALRQNFFRAWFTFVLLALLGFAATAGAGLFALRSLAQPHVWPTFLVTQLALAAMLFTRFWQRGAETVLAAQYPIEAEVVVLVPPVNEVEPVACHVEPGPSHPAAEPTHEEAPSHDDADWPGGDALR